MELRTAAAVKRLNVEHRTSNIEHRMMISLRFVDFKINQTTTSANHSDLNSQPKGQAYPNYAM